MVPIDYVLQNGEVVEIVTSNTSKGPSMDWLGIAKSASARSKIRGWLKKQDKSQNIEKGRTILEKTVKRKGYEVQEIVRTHWLARIAKQMNYSTVNELYTTLSYGGAIVSKVIAKLIELYHEEYDKKALSEPVAKMQSMPKPVTKRVQGKPQNESVILGDDMHGMLVRLSRCCSPVPGDEIIGFITKGRGVSVHRTDCPNITSLPESERVRLIQVKWDDSKVSTGTYNADISIIANDRKGLFSDISRACVDMDVNIAGVNLKTNEDNTVNIALTLSVAHAAEMAKILRTLGQIESVFEVYRTRG
jgi:GTP pyrophosphokinase